MFDSNSSDQLLRPSLQIKSSDQAEGMTEGMTEGMIADILDSHHLKLTALQCTLLKYICLICTDFHPVSIPRCPL